MDSRSGRDRLRDMRQRVRSNLSQLTRKLELKKMTKVTSKKSISFPKLAWGISAGETKELPEDKEAQERILQEPEITLATEDKKVESQIKKTN